VTLQRNSLCQVPEKLNASSMRMSSEPRWGESHQASCKSLGKDLWWARYQLGGRVSYLFGPVDVDVINDKVMLVSLSDGTKHFWTF